MMLAVVGHIMIENRRNAARTPGRIAAEGG